MHVSYRISRSLKTLSSYKQEKIIIIYDHKLTAYFSDYHLLSFLALLINITGLLKKSRNIYKTETRKHVTKKYV